MAHLDAAHNLARWLARDAHDAEDVVQEACMRAFRFFDSFHGGNARAWLLAIVRNTYYTWHDKNREQTLNVHYDEEKLDDNAADDGFASTDLDRLLQQEDDRRLVNRALEQLPAEFREIIVLRELEDLSYREIAEVAAIPLGTVMSRLARGRKLLLRALQHIGKDP